MPVKAVMVNKQVGIALQKPIMDSQGIPHIVHETVVSWEVAMAACPPNSQRVKCRASAAQNGSASSRDVVLPRAIAA